MPNKIIAMNKTTKLVREAKKTSKPLFISRIKKFMTKDVDIELTSEKYKKH